MLVWRYISAKTAAAPRLIENSNQDRDRDPKSSKAKTKLSHHEPLDKASFIRDKKITIIFGGHVTLTSHSSSNSDSDLLDDWPSYICEEFKSNLPHSANLADFSPAYPSTSSSTTVRIDRHSEPLADEVTVLPIKAPVRYIPHHSYPGMYPAVFTRSALFSVARLTRKDVGEPVQISCQAGYEIKSSGPALTIFDKMIWEIVVDFAKCGLANLNESFKTSLSAIARAAGAQSTSDRMLHAVEDSLTRLARARLTIKLPGGKTSAGSLIKSFEKYSHGVYINFDVEFLAFILFFDRQFKLDHNRRKTLTSNLGKWLHDYLSVNEPLSLTLGYYKKLSGYKANPKNFSQIMIKAVAELSIKCPSLVSGFDLKPRKDGRDAWLLDIHRGDEVVKYLQPEFGASKKSEKGKKGTKGRRVGGVCL